MENIGFIGLGRMGKSMALNLQKKGFGLMVHDINTAAVETLVAAGAVRGEGVAGIAAACSIVVTMLPSAVEVEGLALGKDGILANGTKGNLLLDMSTIDPLATDRLQKAAQALGQSVVDAPVGRLAEHADRGESLFMVGASQPDFERVQPLLKAMGSTVFHCGDVGSGGRTKLVNNYCAVSLCQMNAEALALSQKFGLNLVRTLEVLYGTSANNGQLRLNFPNKVLAGDTSPGFTIDLAHKDMALVLSSAHAAKVPMPLAAAVFESFSLARASEYGQIDFSGIADVMCDLAKIERARVPAGWKPI